MTECTVRARMFDSTAQVRPEPMHAMHRQWYLTAKAQQDTIGSQYMPVKERDHLTGYEPEMQGLIPRPVRCSVWGHRLDG